jgi:biopolymer transport protein ExbD
MIAQNRRKRTVPGLNTTSTADISFMLLIFFLVTTSMDTDKGLARRLPPLPDAAQQKLSMPIRQRDMMEVTIDAKNHVYVADGTGKGYVDLRTLKARAMQFIKNANDNPNLPERRMVTIDGLGSCKVATLHVISVQCDRNTDYDAYFQVQDALVAVYNALRDEVANARFGKKFAQCDDAQQKAIRQYYPQKISEAEPQDLTEGGGK